MQSFRTELENPVVEKDIIELEQKIRLFHEGKIDEEKFRSLRLARGVYGQRQHGVQMIRIKLPYGKVTGEQLRRIAAVSDEYSTGKLHITTRQDIQIHHVSLDRTPELWAELERDDITLREACGNTVRNITASPAAGIDPNEAFDVTPYVRAVFEFFLRNPVCQEMGRKFKMSFSGAPDDDALSYMHDLGFIAETRAINGLEERGFKVLLGGGLGSQPAHGDLIYDFLPTDQLIPTIEAVLRVFDRYGERDRRHKARLKFLIKDIGLDAFLKLVEEHRIALKEQRLPIQVPPLSEPTFKSEDQELDETEESPDYLQWMETNVFEQKQKGLYAVGVKVFLGDFSSQQARELANLIQEFGSNELRFTLRQNLLIRNVRASLLPHFYQELNKIGLGEIGYNSASDITACPGTDTCNLGIASSTGIARELERVLYTEYPNYASNKDITIKISGCMNACGQHNMAQIGFQGMSMKAGTLVAPALQILLGGGNEGNGNGRFADKVIKIPSKRGPQALRRLLDDYEKERQSGELFNVYYDRQGKIYFYELLKDLSSSDDLLEEDFIDWGTDKNYVQAIGVGECAGVVIDLVATLLFDTEEKLGNATEAIKDGKWADAIYHSYTSMVNTAKAMLIGDEHKTNTHASIIEAFDTHYVQTGQVMLDSSFVELINQMNANAPSEAFAKTYFELASEFYFKIDRLRKKELANG
jgi:sulfite reductase (ferredoxin)